MAGDADDVFGPVVFEPEPLTVQPGEDPARIAEIQQRVRAETAAYHRDLGKRQFRPRGK